jgi:hypothetical protein
MGSSVKCQQKQIYCQLEWRSYGRNDKTGIDPP